MARDEGLETLVREAVGDEPGLSEKPMFGGLVWLVWGAMLCATRHDGAMIRLGKGADAWALAIPGITQMSAALTFVRTLPPK